MKSKLSELLWNDNIAGYSNNCGLTILLKKKSVEFAAIFIF